MSFDRHALAEKIARQKRVARILVLDVAGSVPRGAGTSMLVWSDMDDSDGQSGTIGGGALEYQAVQAARSAITSGKDTLLRQPLGPNLAQCCGGAVTLLTEIWDAERLAQAEGLIARPLPGGPQTQPLSVTRAIAQNRNGMRPNPPLVVDKWVIETPVTQSRSLWIYGAGHVGRALVNVLHPLPDFQLTWIDTDLGRFPAKPPDTVRILPAPDPALAVRLAPPEAEHLVLTYSHHFDLQICHALLQHGFARAGVIGSKTKWFRFRKRLLDLGHASTEITKISCPIGDPTLGKHPQAIAVGVVSQLLSQSQIRSHSATSTPVAEHLRKAVSQ